jgi:hypothetical protein
MFDALMLLFSTVLLVFGEGARILWVPARLVGGIGIVVLLVHAYFQRFRWRTGEKKAFIAIAVCRARWRWAFRFLLALGLGLVVVGILLLGDDVRLGVAAFAGSLASFALVFVGRVGETSTWFRTGWKLVCVGFTDSLRLLLRPARDEQLAEVRCRVRIEAYGANRRAWGRWAESERVVLSSGEGDSPEPSFETRYPRDFPDTPRSPLPSGMYIIRWWVERRPVGTFTFTYSS